ncbi:hypothetical protein HNY73_011575 [Argiope bruennichi]|uniref:Uncharacterized protein n=1 Tax=Argiope bruennichi TaxID=94029 RepID=A0A8T0EZA4_ARGBR|nr:hypothetical protein HNY73_011575 [Argiope bruennichi]
MSRADPSIVLSPLWVSGSSSSAIPRCPSRGWAFFLPLWPHYGFFCSSSPSRIFIFSLLFFQLSWPVLPFLLSPPQFLPTCLSIPTSDTLIFFQSAHIFSHRHPVSASSLPPLFHLLLGTLDFLRLNHCCTFYSFCPPGVCVPASRVVTYPGVYLWIASPLWAASFTPLVLPLTGRLNPHSSPNAPRRSFSLLCPRPNVFPGCHVLFAGGSRWLQWFPGLAIGFCFLAGALSKWFSLL